MGYLYQTDKMSVLTEQEAHMMDQLEVNLNVQCAICMTTYKDPKLLSCSHTFCMSCLEETFSRQGNASCPVCRLEVQIPRGGVCKLADNPQVFRDAFEALKMMHISKVKPVNSLGDVFKYKIEQYSSQISAILEQQASIKRLLDSCSAKMTESAPLAEEYSTCKADIEKCIADLLDQMDTITSLEGDTGFNELPLKEAQNNINQMFPGCTCNVGTVFYHKLCHLSASLSESSDDNEEDMKDAKCAETSEDPLVPSAPSEDDVFYDEEPKRSKAATETGESTKFVRGTADRKSKKRRSRLSFRNLFRSRKSKTSDSESESDVENSNRTSKLSNSDKSNEVSNSPRVPSIEITAAPSSSHTTCPSPRPRSPLTRNTSPPRSPLVRCSSSYETPPSSIDSWKPCKRRSGGSSFPMFALGAFLLAGQEPSGWGHRGRSRSGYGYHNNQFGAHPSIAANFA